MCLTTRVYGNIILETLVHAYIPCCCVLLTTTCLFTVHCGYYDIVQPSNYRYKFGNFHRNDPILVSQARHFYPSVSEGEKESGHSGQSYVL